MQYTASPSWRRTPSESSQPQSVSRKRWLSRKPLGETPFFPVPFALLDLGFVRFMRPSAIIRYITLLRVGNYDYGAHTIFADERELEKLDGVSTRAAREANIKLVEYGLIQVLKTRPRTYLLNRPECWRLPKPYGPKIVQTKPVRVEDRDLKPLSGHRD